MIDNVYVQWAALFVIMGLMAVGAYTDAKQRIIPNSVNLGIFVCGFFTPGGLAEKAISFGIIAVAMFLATKITKQKSGGGDVKMYLAMAFSLGVFQTALILAGAAVLVKLHNLIKRRRGGKGERYPICCYVAPAYAVYLAVMLVLEIAP